jgi:adenylate cyclase
MSKIIKNRSIKFEILFRIIASVSLSILVIVAYNMYASRQLLVDSAKSFVKKQDESAITALVDYVNSIKNVNDFIAPLYTDLGIDSKALHTQLVRVLTNIDPIDVIRIKKDNADSSLECIQIRPESKMQSVMSHAIPDNAMFYIIRKEKVEGTISFYDKFFTLLKEEKLNETDISEEKQYPKWPNVYIFERLPFIEKESILKRDHENAKMNVKMNIRTLSWILNNLRLTDRTRIFVVDHNMNVIADSDVVDSDKLIPVDDYGNSKLKIALDLYRNNNKANKAEKTDFFSVDNDSFFSIVSDSPKNMDLNWKIVTITSMKDFVEKFSDIEFKCFIISILVMFLILSFLYFQIQKLSEPITHLSIEADKINNIDLGDPVIVNSKLREIKDLNDSMQRVKVSVSNFSKYIPKGLIRGFVDSGEVVEIGGKSKNITIFFSDVANFTTISEKTPPQELILQLSEYFEALSTIILDNQGTIDKFIGDAIMAFWGAPEEDENQVIHACRAALVCQQKLKGLNRYWAAENKPALITRIGIHCGTAVVGNIGSSERMNYTALGDSVNLSARLEGTNKMYGTQILISHDMVTQLTGDFTTRPIDVVAVKGKDKGIRIYELMGLDNDAYVTALPPKVKIFAEAFSEAFELYMNKQWQEALDAFVMLKNENLYESDIVTAMYIERCKNFIISPPSADWDGVVHLKEK